MWHDFLSKATFDLVPTALILNANVHKPTHGANDNECAQIVGNVGDIEFWFLAAGQTRL